MQRLSTDHRLHALLLISLLGSAGCIDHGMERDDAGDPVYPADGGDEPEPEEDAGGEYDAGDQADAEPPPVDAGGDAAEPGSDAGGDGGSDTDAMLDAGAEIDAGGDPMVPPAVGDTYGITSSRRLVLFERASGRLTRGVPISGLGDETVLGADVRPADGQLYLLSSGAKLYTLDLTSGAATLKASLSADTTDATDPFSALVGQRFGVDFNPVADRLRVVSDAGQNLRINASSGATVSDGTLTPASPGVSAAGYTDSFEGACRTRLFVIDVASGKLLLQDPPNDGRLTEVGGLGSIGDVVSFDILSGTDGSTRAFVAAARDGGSVVAEVNLGTGAASPASPVQLAAHETLDHLFVLPPAAAPAQARGELLAITEGNRLISFNRGAPGRLCTSSPIAGLGHDLIVGADIRPADGALYALSKSGRLFTLALETAQATLKSTLVADASDTSDPFACLQGDVFGVGFNPVPDRLRIIGSGGQNLRVNVDTGATTSDASLSPATARVSALGYTSSFAGAKSTTLYALDSSSASLVRVGGDPASGGACPGDVANPNCGVVSTVGSLNLAGTAVGPDGFDVDALSGTAFAAMSLGGAASATLYMVDLGSGAATALGNVGGGERLVALLVAATPTLRGLALTSDDALIAFAPGNPAAAGAKLALTGLWPHEKLLGIDVRPLDGQLYSVSNQGRLLRVDRNTGALAQVAVLHAPGGAALTLPEAEYGLDVNPAADALRLVASSGENFRILPSTRAAGDVGTTFMDTALNIGDGSPYVSAAAYTNNIASAPATTLYVIDGVELALQGGPNGTPSPNLGAITTLGALGVSPWGEVGFDIVGAHNGLALAALSTDGASYKLYSVDLRSGAATRFNSADVAVASGGAKLTGLALSLAP
ncbi:MAG TPA: DUF4394 domain-containing protein [Polyangiales bacterium]